MVATGPTLDVALTIAGESGVYRGAICVAPDKPGPVRAGLDGAPSRRV